MTDPDLGPGEGATGPRLRRLTIGDAPGAWEQAGFAVDDAGCTTGGEVVIELAGGETRGVIGWQLEPVSPDNHRQLEPVLDLFAEALLEPAFDPGEL